MTHSDACNAVLLHLSSLGCLVARREVGLFTDARGHPRRIGLKGEADVSGVAPGGRAIAIEIKTGRGRQTPDQRAYEQAFRARGGLFAIARPDTDHAWKDALTHLVAQP